MNRLTDQIKDRAGYLYRFSLPTSILKKKRVKELA